MEHVRIHAGLLKRSPQNSMIPIGQELTKRAEHERPVDADGSTRASSLGHSGQGLKPASPSANFFFMRGV